MKAELYLFADCDKLLISDIDGTLTRNDIGGIWYNTMQKNFIHKGYADLIEKVFHNGYKVSWLTMRSMAFYQLTKEYLKKFLNVDGPLMT